MDLGCDNGKLSLYMAAFGCDVLGIDIARNAVDNARRSAARHGISNARFEAMDFVNEWNEPGSFDLVLCSHVVEHVPDDVRFLGKIAEAVRPGGMVILLAPTACSLPFIASRLLPMRALFRLDDEVGHLRRYRPRQLVSLIQDAGLSVEELTFLDGPIRDWCFQCRPLRIVQRFYRWRKVRRLINTIDALMARCVPFPGAICITASKP
ncbi:MAG: class I SAM-dependent methyltransferase [Armatimonadetes bacterium]|nr:class I SAM-dependent methyltransferase [Armatimonadota bacterium]